MRRCSAALATFLALLGLALSAPTRAGPESTEHADTLMQQARMLDEAADYPAAIRLYEQALRIYESTVGPTDPKAAAASLHLGSALRTLGKLSLARPHLERSLEVFERSFGSDAPKAADALCSLGWLARDSRDLETAQSLFERSLAVRQATLGADHPDVADSLDGLAYLLWEMSEFDAAYEYARHAVEIRQRSLGPRHPSLATSYVYLTLGAFYSGRVSEAAPAIQSALEIAEATLPADHPALALVLNYYADFLDSVAERPYERALSIFEQAYGPNHWRVAWVLTDMTLNYLFIGEHNRALESMERAVAIWEVSEVKGRQAGSLNRLALVLIEAFGRFEEAREYLERAVLIAPEEGLPLTWRGTIYENLGQMHRRDGDLAAAIQSYELALETGERTSGPQHPHLSSTLAELADLKAEVGDYRAALELAERGVAIIESAFGKDNLWLTENLHQLARLLWVQGDLQGSLETGLRLERVARENIRVQVEGLPERQALGMLASRATNLKRGADLVLSGALTLASPEVKRLAMDTTIRSRGVVLDSLARRHAAVKSSNDPDVTRLDRELTRARDRLAHLAVQQSPDSQSLRASIVTARRDKEAVEARLAKKSRAFRSAQARAAAGFEEVLADLPPGAALVSYIRYPRLEAPPRPATGHWPLETTAAYLAFVLRHDRGVPAVVDLGSAETIEAGVAAVRKQISGVAEAPGRSAKRSEAVYRTTAGNLRQLIWDPLVPHLQGLERIFVVPYGELNLVNLAALPIDPHGYLLENSPIIHYLSAERDLVSPAVEPGGGEGLLALGNPAYDEPRLFARLAAEDNEIFQLAQVDSGAGKTLFRGHRSSCGSFSTMRFKPLPASAGELSDVESAWQSDDRRAASLTTLRGPAANEAAFKMGAAGKRVLHLATHGFFLGGLCPSAIDPATTRSSGSHTADPEIENPLLLAGLALAGANHRDAAGADEEDGILTAEEISALDLTGVEWAVLSACETGVGEISAGEGVFGLRRAFEIAGARTVIMSLWPVDDEASREWMKSLYGHRLLGGKDTSDAVHQASLDLLNRRRAAGESTHPFFWAGFVAAGDWR